MSDDPRVVYNLSVPGTGAASVSDDILMNEDDFSCGVTAATVADAFDATDQVAAGEAVAKDGIGSNDGFMEDLTVVINEYLKSSNESNVVINEKIENYNENVTKNEEIENVKKIDEENDNEVMTKVNNKNEKLNLVIIKIDSCKESKNVDHDLSDIVTKPSNLPDEKYDKEMVEDDTGIELTSVDPDSGANLSVEKIKIIDHNTDPKIAANPGKGIVLETPNGDSTEPVTATRLIENFEAFLRAPTEEDVLVDGSLTDGDVSNDFSDAGRNGFADEIKSSVIEDFTLDKIYSVVSSGADIVDKEVNVDSPDSNSSNVSSVKESGTTVIRDEEQVDLTGFNDLEIASDNFDTEEELTAVKVNELFVRVPTGIDGIVNKTFIFIDSSSEEKIVFDGLQSSVGNSSSITSDSPVINTSNPDNEDVSAVAAEKVDLATKEDQVSLAADEKEETIAAKSVDPFANSQVENDGNVNRPVILSYSNDSFRGDAVEGSNLTTKKSSSNYVNDSSSTTDSSFSASNDSSNVLNEKDFVPGDKKQVISAVNNEEVTLAADKEKVPLAENFKSSVCVPIGIDGAVDRPIILSGFEELSSKSFPSNDFSGALNVGNKSHFIAADEEVALVEANNTNGFNLAGSDGIIDRPVYFTGHDVAFKKNCFPEDLKSKDIPSSSSSSSSSDTVSESLVSTEKKAPQPLKTIVERADIGLLGGGFRIRRTGFQDNFFKLAAKAFDDTAEDFKDNDLDLGIRVVNYEADSSYSSDCEVEETVRSVIGEDIPLSVASSTFLKPGNFVTDNVIVEASQGSCFVSSGAIAARDEYSHPFVFPQSIQSEGSVTQSDSETETDSNEVSSLEGQGYFPVMTDTTPPEDEKSESFVNPKSLKPMHSVKIRESLNESIKYSIHAAPASLKKDAKVFAEQDASRLVYANCEEVIDNKVDDIFCNNDSDFFGHHTEYPQGLADEANNFIKEIGEQLDKERESSYFHFVYNSFSEYKTIIMGGEAKSLADELKEVLNKERRALDYEKFEREESFKRREEARKMELNKRQTQLGREKELKSILKNSSYSVGSDPVKQDVGKPPVRPFRYIELYLRKPSFYETFKNCFARTKKNQEKVMNEALIEEETRIGSKLREIGEIPNHTVSETVELSSDELELVQEEKSSQVLTDEEAEVCSTLSKEFKNSKKFGFKTIILVDDLINKSSDSNKVLDRLDVVATKSTFMKNILKKFRELLNTLTSKGSSVLKQLKKLFIELFCGFESFTASKNVEGLANPNSKISDNDSDDGFDDDSDGDPLGLVKLFDEDGQSAIASKRIKLFGFSSANVKTNSTTVSIKSDVDPKTSEAETLTVSVNDAIRSYVDSDDASDDEPLAPVKLFEEEIQSANSLDDSRLFGSSVNKVFRLDVGSSYFLTTNSTDSVNDLDNVCDLSINNDFDNDYINNSDDDRLDLVKLFDKYVQSATIILNDTESFGSSVNKVIRLSLDPNYLESTHSTDKASDFDNDCDLESDNDSDDDLLLIVKLNDKVVQSPIIINDTKFFGNSANDLMIFDADSGDDLLGLVKLFGKNGQSANALNDTELFGTSTNDVVKFDVDSKTVEILTLTSPAVIDGNIDDVAPNNIVYPDECVTLSSRGDPESKHIAVNRFLPKLEASSNNIVHSRKYSSWFNDSYSIDIYDDEFPPKADTSDGIRSTFSKTNVLEENSVSKGSKSNNFSYSDDTLASPVPSSVYSDYCDDNFTVASPAVINEASSNDVYHPFDCYAVATSGEIQSKYISINEVPPKADAPIKKRSLFSKNAGIKMNPFSHRFKNIDLGYDESYLPLGPPIIDYDGSDDSIMIEVSYSEDCLGNDNVESETDSINDFVPKLDDSNEKKLVPSTNNDSDNSNVKAASKRDMLKNLIADIHCGKTIYHQLKDHQESVNESEKTKEFKKTIISIRSKLSRKARKARKAEETRLKLEEAEEIERVVFREGVLELQKIVDPKGDFADDFDDYAELLDIIPEDAIKDKIEFAKQAVKDVAERNRTHTASANAASEKPPVIQKYPINPFNRKRYPIWKKQQDEKRLKKLQESAFYPENFSSDNAATLINGSPFDNAAVSSNDLTSSSNDCTLVTGSTKKRFIGYNGVLKDPFSNDSTVEANNRPDIESKNSTVEANNLFDFDSKDFTVEAEKCLDSDFINKVHQEEFNKNKDKSLHFAVSINLNDFSGREIVLRSNYPFEDIQNSDDESFSGFEGQPIKLPKIRKGRIFGSSKFDRNHSLATPGSYGRDNSGNLDYQNVNYNVIPSPFLKNLDNSKFSSQPKYESFSEKTLLARPETSIYEQHFTRVTRNPYARACFQRELTQESDSTHDGYGCLSFASPNSTNPKINAYYTGSSSYSSSPRYKSTSISFNAEESTSNDRESGSTSEDGDLGSTTNDGKLDTTANKGSLFANTNLFGLVNFFGDFYKTNTPVVNSDVTPDNSSLERDSGG